VAPAARIPVLDAHIHLFEVERTGGVPWPPASDGILYRSATTTRLRSLARGTGLAGAIAVECSPLPEDNEWLLETASRDPLIVGVVANLEPGAPGFGNRIEGLAAHPLLVGIRSGNLWGRDFSRMISDYKALADLKDLAHRGLTLDVANPDTPLLEGVARLSKGIPELRIVIDHLPGFDPPSADAPAASHRALLAELASRPSVYVKVSAVLRRRAGAPEEDPSEYAPRLSDFWDLFGADRLLYASDWPNSDHRGPYGSVFSVVNAYLEGRCVEDREKFFHGNARAAYPRARGFQPGARAGEQV